MEHAMSRDLAHPTADDLELTHVLHALSDPVRLQIVRSLADRDCNCGDIALPVTKSTSTHHFRVLRESGVIEQQREGTARINKLRRDDLEARFPGVLDSVLKSSA
jgi:DNA-binding transcriptional ArsR family regulator